MDLQLLDFVSFFGYFFFLSFIGWYVGRSKKQAASDYFLAGKTLPWYVVGSSYIAANISTEHFLGMIGAAVLYGIVVATPEWSAVIAFSFLIWLFIPFLLGSKVYTTPEFLEKRFNKEIRLLFAFITILANVTAFMAPVIYGGGLIVEEALGFNKLMGLDITSITAGYIPNWGLFISIFLIAFASGVWAIWGGLKSVAWMDVLTIVIMVMGGLMVTFLGLSYIGDGSIVDGFSRMINVNQCHDGWASEWLNKNVVNMLAGSAEGDTYNRLSVLQPVNHTTTPWTHWVFSFFYIGLWYTVINQHMIQKVFAAKDIYHARMGMVFASFLKLLLPFIVVVPGLIWFVMKPDFLFSSNWSVMSEEANKTYIMMISKLVPPFMTGLLLAALFGAIQSTVSSVLNSTSTIFTLDFYKHYVNRQATEAQEVRVGEMGWCHYSYCVYRFGGIAGHDEDKHLCLHSDPVYLYRSSVLGHLPDRYALEESQRAGRVDRSNRIFCGRYSVEVPGIWSFGRFAYGFCTVCQAFCQPGTDCLGGSNGYLHGFRSFHS